MNIEDSFVELLKTFYLERSKTLSRAFDNRTPRVTRMKMKMVAERLRKQDIEKDLELLKKLPYTSFGVRKGYLDKPYFVGVTQPIIVMFEKDGNYVYQDLGNYVVGIPLRSMLSSNINAIHFVPVKQLHIRDRHYHHYANRSRLSNKNPLTHEPQTCWGSVGSLILNALSIADVPSVFESLYVFLKSVDYDDRLTNINWAKAISEEAYCQLTGTDPFTLVKHQYPDADLFG